LNRFPVQQNASIAQRFNSLLVEKECVGPCRGKEIDVISTRPI
jgi:hypothetical protein